MFKAERLCYYYNWSEVALESVERRRREADRRGGGERKGRWQPSKKELKTEPWEPDGPLPTLIYIYIYIYGHGYAFAFTAPDLAHHHFFPLFPRFHLILNKTNILVWTQCVQTCNSHLHTCRLHKRTVVFTVFQISESWCFCSFLSWKAPCKHMWSSHASFLLHSVCV